MNKIGTFKIEEVDSISYFFRRIYLVKFTNESGYTDGKPRYAIFYKSAGMSTPEIKNSDEVFPILGILDYGKLGEKLRELYPNMPEGWIAKGATSINGNKCRENIETYFNQSSLRELSRMLEEGRFKESKVGVNTFFNEIDYLYRMGDEHFFTVWMLNHLNGKK